VTGRVCARTHLQLQAVRYIPNQLAYACVGMLVQTLTLTAFTVVIYTIAVAVTRYDLLPPSATGAQATCVCSRVHAQQ
jgi:hypothetical protein